MFTFSDVLSDVTSASDQMKQSVTLKLQLALGCNTVSSNKDTIKVELFADILMQNVTYEIFKSRLF